MVPGSLKETPDRKNRMNQSGSFPRLSSFVAGTVPNNQSVDVRAACLVCSKQHDIWKCSKFKGLTYEEKWRLVRSGGLCNKCLVKGHVSKEFPKVNFKCQRLGCGGNHHTLMHRPTARIGRDLRSGSNQRDNASQSSNNGTSVSTEQQLPQVSSGPRDVTGAGNGNGIAVAATGINIPAVGDTEVLLLIGLKERPSLFLPLEFKAGGVDEPIAI